MTKPIHVLSLGAGVQSSTLALIAGGGGIAPMPDGAVFADTQDEPQSVYNWLNFLEPLLPFRVHRVTAGKLSDSSLLMKRTADGRLFSKTNIPVFTLNHDGSKGKIRMRGCTRDFKLKVILALIRLLIGKIPMRDWRRKHKAALKALAAYRKSVAVAKKSGNAFPPRPMWAWDECQSDPLAVSWIGISTDEVYRLKESRDPWIKNRWPLIELGMNRQACLQWMREHGHPEPPRSACIYCPFHNDAEWRRLKTTEPLEFAKAVAFERELQRVKSASQNFRTLPFLHRSCLPIDKVDFSTEEDRGQGNLFDNECEGICGV